MAVRRAEGLRDALEEEILMGTLRPGDRLEEPALAERFGVSRTPIREALHHLAAAGLIETHGRRGTFVAEIGPRRLLEMFDVMAGLEAMCAERAARRATEAEVETIRAAHLACAEAAADGDADGFYYANERFHEGIRAASRNGFLVEQADGLQRRLKPYRRLQLRARGRLRLAYEEHGRILEAIEAGDGPAAAAAMRAHVTVQGDRFADLVASLDAA